MALHSFIDIDNAEKITKIITIACRIKCEIQK